MGTGHGLERCVQHTHLFCTTHLSLSIAQRRSNPGLAGTWLTVSQHRCCMRRALRTDFGNGGDSEGLTADGTAKAAKHCRSSLRDNWMGDADRLPGQIGSRPMPPAATHRQGNPLTMHRSFLDGYRPNKKAAAGKWCVTILPTAALKPCAACLSGNGLHGLRHHAGGLGNEPHELAFLGVTACFGLGVDQIAVHNDFKPAASGGDQLHGLNPRLELGEEVFCRTGSHG